MSGSKKLLGGYYNYQPVDNYNISLSRYLNYNIIITLSFIICSFTSNTAAEYKTLAIAQNFGDLVVHNQSTHLQLLS